MELRPFTSSLDLWFFVLLWVRVAVDMVAKRRFLLCESYEVLREFSRVWSGSLKYFERV